jgi:hypothetical protein
MFSLPPIHNASLHLTFDSQSCLGRYREGVIGIVGFVKKKEIQGVGRSGEKIENHHESNSSLSDNEDQPSGTKWCGRSRLNPGLQRWSPGFSP